MEENKRGGKREGSGRPQKEKTSLINFRITKDQKNKLKELYPDLNKRFKEWAQTLIK